MTDQRGDAGGDQADTGIELSVQTEMPKRRILLQAAGRTVEVEGPDDLAVLERTAVNFWMLTDDSRIVAGVGHSVGFTGEMAAQPDVAAYAPDDDWSRPMGPITPRMVA